VFDCPVKKKKSGRPSWTLKEKVRPARKKGRSVEEEHSVPWLGPKKILGGEKDLVLCQPRDTPPSKHRKTRA